MTRVLSGTAVALDHIPRVKTKEKKKKLPLLFGGETCDPAFQSRSVMEEEEEEDRGKESIVFDGRGKGSEDKEETQGSRESLHLPLSSLLNLLRILLHLLQAGRQVRSKGSIVGSRVAFIFS